MSTMQEVAEQLSLLENANGRLVPTDVVEAARDPTSPLHPYFEWDDTEAAKQHRLGQARQLIRRVKIETTVRDVPLQVVRYVQDPEGAENGYRDIQRFRAGDEIARQVVLDEMQRVVKAARRAKAVAAVLGMAEDVERIVEAANGVRDQAAGSPIPPVAQ